MPANFDQLRRHLRPGVTITVEKNGELAEYIATGTHDGMIVGFPTSDTLRHTLDVCKLDLDVSIDPADVTHVDRFSLARLAEFAIEAPDQRWPDAGTGLQH